MHDWRVALHQRLGARHIDSAVLDELVQHLDDRYQSLLARGTDAEHAKATVLNELDDDALKSELLRAEREWAAGAAADDRRHAGSMHGWQHDICHAVRALRNSAGFTAAAVFTLALGVGANTAMFSVLNAVMLRSLPYPHADRLVRVFESNPTNGYLTFSASQPNFLDWRRQSKTTELAATQFTNPTVMSDQGAEVVRGARVTAGFLPVLQVPLALGRNFVPDEDRPGGDVRVAILSDGFWRRRFAANPSAIGQGIELNGNVYRIVGVLTPSFQWNSVAVDVLIPLVPDPASGRGDHQIVVIGRLKDTVTLAQAHEELSAIAATLAVDYPGSNKGWSVVVRSLYNWLVPLGVRNSLGLLFGAVVVLLLIACANVANLLVARAAVRQKEMAIRAALGAARWRIVRQLLTESFLLAIIAGIIGVATGAAVTRLLVAFGPPGIPRLNEATFDATVALFGVSISIVTAMLFGLAPAIQLSGHSPAATLQDSARGSSAGAGRQRLRSLLTIIEVALSVALLIGAALLLRSSWRLQQVDPGFNVGSVMMARVSLPSSQYTTPASRASFYDRLLTEVAALPGIEGAAVSSGVPLAGGYTSTEIHMPGGDPGPAGASSAEWRVVSPGYFATMGIQLRGRDFTAADRDDVPVTIVNETMARQLWPGRDPIGQSVLVSSLGGRARTIIGVAADVHHTGLEAAPSATVYLPTAVTFFPSMGLIWRSAGQPVSHTDAIRRIVSGIDPTVPLWDPRTMDTLVADSVAARRFNLYLIGCFAALAIVLAAVGLFGLTAYLVSQRTRELGLRLALGAGRKDIFLLILGRGIAVTITGAIVGLGAAFALTPAMETLLYSVSSTDPASFAAVPLLIVVIALTACCVPAWRAMRMDPLAALRVE